MPSDRDDPAQEASSWQPSWRRPRAIDPAYRPPAEVVRIMRLVDRLVHIHDLCRLVGFRGELPNGCGSELFDPAAAIDRLERYRTDPTPASAAAAREAILQFVRTLPAEPGAARVWEAAFRRRDMAELLSDPPGGA